jgi:glucosylceramidase
MRHLNRGIFAVLFYVALATVAQGQSSVSVFLTTADRSALFARQGSTLAFGKPVANLPTIEVDDKHAYQRMEGFGFALTGGSAQLLMRMDAQERSALLKELFATDGDGLGVSYLRVSIGSSDMNDHAFTYDDMPAGQTDPELAKFDFGPDMTTVIPVLKEILAIHPFIRILGSPWSAPAWMKTNDALKDGSLKPEFYPVYAQYLVKYLTLMRAQGINVDAITVQNEPLNPHNTPSMVMQAADQANFIQQALGPAFHKAHIRAKILVYDHNCDRPDYPLTILKDPGASRYVDGSAFHLYGGEITALTAVHDAFPKKNVYFTEQMVVDRKGRRSATTFHRRARAAADHRSHSQLEPQRAALELSRRSGVTAHTPTTVAAPSARAPSPSNGRHCRSQCARGTPSLTRRSSCVPAQSASPRTS